MQIGSASDTTQVPAGKTATSVASHNAKSGFPADLLSALLSTSQKTPPGPEPPFPLTQKVGVEEAAEAPNAPTQKLDSPHRNQKAKSDPQAAALPASQTPIAPIGLTGPTGNVVKDMASAPTQPASKALEPTNAVANVKAKSEQVSDRTGQPQASLDPIRQGQQGQKPRMLPTDQAAPIVSVKRIAGNQPGQAEATDPNKLKDVEPSKLDAKVGDASTASVKRSVEHDQVQSESSSKPAAKKVDSAQKSEIAVASASRSGSKGGSSSFGQSSGQGKGDRSTPKQDSSTLAISSPTASSATIAKPAELKGIQNLDRHALVQQVADKLQALAASRSQEGVVVQLAPKALGSVTLTIKSMGAGVEAHIAASDDQVRKALEASRPDLVQSMQNRGYQVTSVTVSTQTATSTDGSHQQQPQFRPQPQAANLPANDSSTTGANQAHELTPTRPINPYGVDISI